MPCLSEVDRVCEKLLANADRWNDAAIKSRDLIDLAIMRIQHKIPERSIQKAEAAYPVISPLQSAVKKFRESEVYRDKCFNALQIECREQVLSGVNLLFLDFPNGSNAGR